jgi:hypothetical protein
LLSFARDVLAAAIRGGADVIVTANLRHFPANILRQFGIEARHPDKFIMSLVSQSLGVVVSAARDHRKSLKNPPKTIDQYLGALEAQGLTRTVVVLRECL